MVDHFEQSLLLALHERHTFNDRAIAHQVGAQVGRSRTSAVDPPVVLHAADGGSRGGSVSTVVHRPTPASSGMMGPSPKLG